MSIMSRPPPKKKQEVGHFAQKKSFWPFLGSYKYSMLAVNATHFNNWNGNSQTAWNLISKYIMRGEKIEYFCTQQPRKLAQIDPSRGCLLPAHSCLTALSDIILAFKRQNSSRLLLLLFWKYWLTNKMSPCYCPNLKAPRTIPLIDIKLPNMDVSISVFKVYGSGIWWWHHCNILYMQ